MEILAYGEDALTLWALKNKLEEILKKLDDDTSAPECTIFFRPSFARGGGKAAFGEFDFVILSKNRLYLGESKWGKSLKFRENRTLKLEDAQRWRHKMFKFYVEQWFYIKPSNWADFTDKAEKNRKECGIEKPLAPVNSLLASNIETILNIINAPPEIGNILLYLHNGVDPEHLPKNVDDDFKMVFIDYSSAVTNGNFIKIEI